MFRMKYMCAGHSSQDKLELIHVVSVTRDSL